MIVTARPDARFSGFVAPVLSSVPKHCEILFQLFSRTNLIKLYITHFGVIGMVADPAFNETKPVGMTLKTNADGLR